MTRPMILPGATLGLLGGGQLGRLFVLAARAMGYRVTVLDPAVDSPAAQVADRHLAADYDDEQALEQLARECAAVTTEFENVPAASLEYLAARVPVRPASEAGAGPRAPRWRVVAAVLSLPQHVDVTEIEISPTDQAVGGHVFKSVQG